MSGPLLLGIVGIGVGWAWLHRKGDKMPSAIGATVAADGTDVKTDEANHANVDVEVPHPSGGLAAVSAAVDASSYASTVGAVPVEGSDGGQVIPASFETVDGAPALVVDRTKSTGGADPSTQMTAIHTGETPPFINPGDTSSVIFTTLFGPAADTGLTDQQRGNAIRDSAVWSNEVF